jgi:serine/threonine-protein kinase
MGVDNLIGREFGQYHLRELLGVGGMGAVYRAYQTNLKRDVAFKVLSPALTQDSDYYQRFIREAEIAASLEHIHIVPVYDYGTHERIPYVVMRLLGGGSLSERIKNQSGRPALREAAEVLTQIASALDYAHGRGIVHRDIKASNVMFDERGSAFLVDFGIAKLINATTSITGTGIAMGTPLYMAPEQWRGESITAAADQYALGILVYAMITGGKMPFEGETPFALMHKHLFEPPTPPQNFRHDLPNSIKMVLERAMAKDASERYVSVTAFADAFRGAAAGVDEDATGYFTVPVARAARPPLPTPASRTPTPLVDGPTTTGRPTAEPERSTARPARSWAVWLALLGVLLIVGVGIVAFNPDQRASLVALVVPPTPTPTPTITPSPTASATPSRTPTASATATATNTPTPTATPTATASDTPTATDTPTPSATPTPATPIALPLREMPLRLGPGSVYPVVGTVPVDEPLAILGVSEDGAWYLVETDADGEGWLSASAFSVDAYGDLRTIRVAQAPTETPTDTATPSATPTDTSTPTPTASATSTDTPTPTASATPTDTATPSATPTLTPTPTDTFTPTPLATDTPTLTTTPSITPTPTPVPFLCPRALPTRLTVGDVGIVSDDDPRPLNVRTSAGLNSARQGQIVVGARFQVLNGPICSDGSVWYRVRYGSLSEGWIAEGSGSTYFVEPAADEDDAYIPGTNAQWVLAPQCSLILEDTFAGDESPYNWFTDAGDDYFVGIRNGSYTVDIQSEADGGDKTSWGTLQEITLDNVSIEAVMRASRFETWETRVGLWHNVQDPRNFIAFMLHGSGQYRVALFQSGYTDLIGWTGSAAVNVGDNAVNTLRIDIRGGSYEYYLNGQFLNRVQDAPLPAGRMTFFGSSSLPPITFYLDYLRICAL